jgi:hypothetical protein
MREGDACDTCDGLEMGWVICALLRDDVRKLDHDVSSGEEVAPPTRIEWLCWGVWADMRRHEMT